MADNPTEFASSDKNLVAFLHSNGHRWFRHDISGNIVTFRFPYSPDIDKDAKLYPVSREALFASSLNTIWGVIRSMRSVEDGS